MLRHKSFLIVGIAIVSVLVVTMTSLAAYDFQIAVKKSGTWKGIEVDLIMVEPSLQPNSNMYVAAPVALTVMLRRFSSKLGQSRLVMPIKLVNCVLITHMQQPLPVVSMRIRRDYSKAVETMAIG